MPGKLSFHDDNIEKQLCFICMICCASHLNHFLKMVLSQLCSVNTFGLVGSIMVFLSCLVSYELGQHIHVLLLFFGIHTQLDERWF